MMLYVGRSLPLLIFIVLHTSCPVLGMRKNRSSDQARRTGYRSSVIL